MIKSKAATDEIQAGIDMLRGALKSILNILGILFMEELKPGFAREDGVDRAQQPVEVKVIIGLVPFLESRIHRVPGFRPFGANFGQS